MKECPNCAVEIQDRQETCPICKYEFPQKAVLPWKPVALVVAGVFLFYLILSLVRNLSR